MEAGVVTRAPGLSLSVSRVAGGLGREGPSSSHRPTDRPAPPVAAGRLSAEREVLVSVDLARRPLGGRRWCPVDEAHRPRFYTLTFVS